MAAAAMRRKTPRVGFAANGDERRHRSGRKAEDSDLALVDARCSAPVTGHEVDRAHDMARAVGEPGRLADIAFVLKIVAAVRGCHDDEPGLGQRHRSVDVTDRRRAFIAISDSAADAMARYFAELGPAAPYLA